MDGKILQVEEMQHRTPGNLRAFYQLKLRDVKNGRLVEDRFRPGDTVEILRIETNDYQYLYEEGDTLVVMDPTSFDQINIEKELLGSSVVYLKEGITIRVAFENGTNPITAEAPAHVILNVTYTEPGLAGDTATRTLKAATVETGAEIRVPLFVNTGDNVKIKTATGEYVERVK